MSAWKIDKLIKPQQLPKPLPLRSLTALEEHGEYVTAFQDTVGTL
jgi:hypothetical protein